MTTEIKAAVERLRDYLRQRDTFPPRLRDYLRQRDTFPPRCPHPEYADILAVCDALEAAESWKESAELAMDLGEVSTATEAKREIQAEALRWAATGILARAENLKPYPRGAVRNVGKLLNSQASAIERGEINLTKGE